MKRMPLAISIVILLGLPAVSAAQVIPDTLDNRRYYPLAVGNEWQYTSTDFVSPIPSYERRRITESTDVGDRTYFRLITERFDHSFQLTSEQIIWLRYNQRGAVRSFSDPDDDAPDADTATFWYHADFGDTLSYSGSDVLVSGAYDSTIVLNEDLPVLVASAKVRRGLEPNTGTEVVVSDIGLVHRITHDGPTTNLSYARIGGDEYGERVVGVTSAREPSLPKSTIITSVYPNPATDRVTVNVRSAGAGGLNLEVRDILGRQVQAFSSIPGGVQDIIAGIDISTLPAGMYFVVLTSASGSQSAPFIVARN